MDEAAGRFLRKELHPVEKHEDVGDYLAWSQSENRMADSRLDRCLLWNMGSRGNISMAAMADPELSRSCIVHRTAIVFDA